MTVAGTDRLTARAIIAQSDCEPMGPMHGVLVQNYGLGTTISVRASVPE
jgi:hypothetical protein